MSETSYTSSPRYSWYSYLIIFGGVMKRDGVTLDEALASVGFGWHKILTEFYRRMDSLGVPYEVGQVKEKFGGLRIYMDVYPEPYTKLTDAWIEAAEFESFECCQNCGTEGSLRTDLGWMLTLCDNCYSKVIAK